MNIIEAFPFWSLSTSLYLMLTSSGHIYFASSMNETKKAIVFYVDFKMLQLFQT